MCSLGSLHFLCKLPKIPPISATACHPPATSPFSPSCHFPLPISFLLSLSHSPPVLTANLFPGTDPRHACQPCWVTRLISVASVQLALWPSSSGALSSGHAVWLTYLCWKLLEAVSEVGQEPPLLNVLSPSNLAPTSSLREN